MNVVLSVLEGEVKMHLLWRIALLFSFFSLGAQLVFGFDHIASLRTIYQASSPHVEAFSRGVTSYKWIDAVLLVVGFLFRRGITLIVTKVLTLIGTVVMPSRLRRTLGDVTAFPKEFTLCTISRLNNWHATRWGNTIAVWVEALQYSLLLFALVLVALEAAVALLQGALLLPPIVLEYKVQIFTGVGSLALGTFAQAFLLAVWNQCCKLLPDRLWTNVDYYKIRSFRRAVRTRRALARVRQSKRVSEQEGP